MLAAVRAIPLGKTVEVRQRDDTELSIAVTTEHCSYSVSASLETDSYLGSYLGCIAHVLSGGGNDLRDGALSADVLDDMCWEIECYDAVFSGRAVDGSRPNRWAGATKR